MSIWVVEVTDEMGLFWVEFHPNTGQSAKDVWLTVHKEEPKAKIVVSASASKESYLALFH